MIINGQLSESVIDPNTLIPPYNNVLKAIRRDPNWSFESLINTIGIQPIAIAREAVTNMQNLNGDDVNWVSVLETTYAMHSAGIDLEKLGVKMQKGENVDLSILHEIAQKAISGQGKLTPMSKIVARDVPFIPSGFKPLDVHMGGLPAMGLVTVGGATKAGKTTFAIRLAIQFLKLYKDKRVAFFSIEMMQDELKMRMLEVSPKLEYVDPETGETIRDEILDRWDVADSPTTPEGVINIASQIENLGMVVIDFADLLIQGEASESKYASMYVTLMLAAKKLGVPIILLAQFSRQYTGGMPRPNYLRYTGLAEALSWMLITLWNPEIGYHKDNNDEDEEFELPMLDGHAFIIPWLCRGGFRNHKDDSPGAIAVRFDGEKGYDFTRDGAWYSLRKEPKRKKVSMRDYR